MSAPRVIMPTTNCIKSILSRNKEVITDESINIYYKMVYLYPTAKEVYAAEKTTGNYTNFKDR